MQRKEQILLTLRWACFAVLLAGVMFRLADRADWSKLQTFFHSVSEEPPSEAETSPAEISFPTMYFEVAVPAGEDSPVVQPVSVYNTTGTTLDLEALLSAPIEFDLAVDGPVILIVHTHATEAYSDAWVSGYSSYDTTQNVVRVGQAMADRLNENGIYTLHDTTLNDAPGYNDAYERTAQVISGYLEEFPTIQMVIDVHRDSIADDYGNELPMLTTLNGESAAQMLLVMGSNISGMDHPNWQSNLSFALRLQSYCEASAPGVFREIVLRSNRYNEHFTPHSILLEVGSAGNTLDQALTSAVFFADRLTGLLTSI